MQLRGVSTLVVWLSHNTYNILLGIYSLRIGSNKNLSYKDKIDITNVKLKLGGSAYMFALFMFSLYFNLNLLL
jgi:hypothetical protein